MLRRRDRIKRALAIIRKSGGVDGAHHKQYVLDQVVRHLTGDEEFYRDWVRAFNDGEDGPNTYQWDQGTPP